MRSPVLVLDRFIAASPFRIAPERENELDAWRTESGFEIVLVDEKGFGIRVNTATAKCTVPIAALELLWSCSYAFLVFYDEYNKAQARGATQFDISSLPQTRMAWDLLRWALDNVRLSGINKWPDEMPKPGTSEDSNSALKMADELFLCAIAWILHHEIAHVRKGHTPFDTLYTIEQEKEADLEATTWILSQSAVERELKKRTLGIAAAILAFQTMESPGSKVGFKTHPEAFQRLYTCLTTAGIDACEDVYAFAAVLLQIQAAQYGIKANLDPSSFRELLEGLLVDMARYGR